MEIPPLRERKEDIIPLARLAIQKTNEPELTLASDARPVLEGYHWPGNVRELWDTVQMLAGDCRRAQLTGAVIQKALNARTKSARPSDRKPDGQKSTMQSPSSVTVESILKGGVSWDQVKCEPDVRKAALMIAAVGRNRRKGKKQQDLAKMLHVIPNTIEQFLRKTRNQLREGELTLDGLRGQVEPPDTEYLESFVAKALLPKSKE